MTAGLQNQRRRKVRSLHYAALPLEPSRSVRLLQYFSGLDVTQLVATLSKRFCNLKRSIATEYELVAQSRIATTILVQNLLANVAQCAFVLQIVLHFLFALFVLVCG
jgi:hypothetical protein